MTSFLDADKWILLVCCKILGYEIVEKYLTVRVALIRELGAQKDFKVLRPINTSILFMFSTVSALYITTQLQDMYRSFSFSEMFCSIAAPFALSWTC
jgi:hypothetical protein